VVIDQLFFVFTNEQWPWHRTWLGGGAGRILDLRLQVLDLRKAKPAKPL